MYSKQNVTFTNEESTLLLSLAYLRGEESTMFHILIILLHLMVLRVLQCCIQYQGSRLRRPSILNTRYFRFGRKFRLSVCPSGRDFYEGNISALEANFGVRKRRYASNIYNTENKLYILKINGFERFPGKLFTSTIVKRDISYTSISTQNVIYRKKA